MLTYRYLLRNDFLFHGPGNETLNISVSIIYFKLEQQECFCGIDAGFLWGLSTPVISKVGFEYPRVCTRQSIAVWKNVIYMIDKQKILFQK